MRSILVLVLTTLVILSVPLPSVLPSSMKMKWFVWQTSTPGIITAEELQNSAFIISDQDYGVESRSVLEKLHLNANSTITATDDAGLVAMASAGLGFCILGRLVLKGTTSPVNVYSFHPRQFRHIALLQKKNVALSPAAEIFQKHIISYASSYPNPAIPFNI